MTEREYPEELHHLAEMEESRDRRPTASQVLVELALRETELWHTPDEEAWAAVHVDGRREHFPVRSKGFRSWLSRRFYESEGRVPGSQAVQDALNVLEGEAIYGEGEREHQVFIRVGGHENAVYVDLGRDYAEVDADGWRIVPDSPVRFWRPRGGLPLPEPVSGGSLDELRTFIRTETEDGFVLAVSWLLGTLRPRGPYPILDIVAEQGSGKSFASKVLRSLVDPAEVPLRRPPRDEHGLFIWASNCHIMAMDNLSGVQDWMSDALCTIATGGGYASRQLYSDKDESILHANNPVVINGIPDVVNRADLRDRTLLVTLERMSEQEIKDEASLWREFEDARPRLLGALLNAVAAALRHWDDVRMDRKPRMSDFAHWVCAAEQARALPWEPGRFLSVYMRQRDSAASEALESDPLAQAVLQLAEGTGTWVGNATELLTDLGAVVDDQTKRSKAWPQTPRNLSNRLRRLAPDLRKGAGVEVSFTREGHEWKRVIKIENVRESSSATSATSANAKKARNDAVFRADDSADHADDSADGADDSADGASAIRSPENLDTQGIFGTADDADYADAKKRAYSSKRVVDEL